MVGQAAEPTVLESLRRRPGAVAEGELWRLITPLLVHAYGWPHYFLNLVSLLPLGSVLESRVGPWRLLLIYFGSGLSGEILGMAWRPHGAGASLGVAGVLGALVALFAWRREGLKRVAVLVGFLGLVAATFVVQDTHGLPALVGASLWIATERMRRHESDVVEPAA